MPNAEKKVATTIDSVGLEVYLPLYRTVRSWSDRKRTLFVPLFPNYIFVRVSHDERMKLFAIRGVLRFVSCERNPVVVRDSEIESIKCILDAAGHEVEREDYFREGSKIRLKDGPLVGIEGIVYKRAGENRLLIKIESLLRAFSVSVPRWSAEPCEKK